MPDTILRPVPAQSSVSSVLAALNTIRDLLNANEDPAQEGPLGETHGEVQARFVAEPIRSLADVITKLEFVVGEDELDSIDERIVQDVIAFLRSQVAA
jgi:hypothetical protein